MANPFEQFTGGAPPPAEEEAPPTARITVRPVGVPDPPSANPFEQYTGGASAPPPVETPRSARREPEMRAAEPDATLAAKWKVMNALEAAGMKQSSLEHIANAIVQVPATLTSMGSVLSAVDLKDHLPKAFSGDNKLRNAGHAALDVLGMIPGVTSARRMLRGTPTVVPAHSPPPQQWMDRSWRNPVDPPTSIAGTPHHQQGFVTPSAGELAGRGPNFNEPVGTAQQAYNAVGNSPVRYHPNMGHDLYALLTRHIQAVPGGGFSRQKAPLVYDTLEQNAAQWAREGRLITPTDIDTLRQQLRGLPDANGPAGAHAINMLDRYMVQPPPGRLMQGTPQDLHDIRANLTSARGDYRSGKTAGTVEDAIDRSQTKSQTQHSGMNTDNLTRQNMAAFSETQTGRDRIFAARPEERTAIWQASQGRPVGNVERTVGKYLGGGGGLGAMATGSAGTAAATALALKFGLDPVTAGALIAGGAVGPPLLGRQLLHAGNQRTVDAAESAAALIRRNSPEYERRLAASGGPIANPGIAARDQLTMALMPQLRESAGKTWDEGFVPYEQR